MNTALEYSTRVAQEGGRRCKKSTLNDLVHLTPLRIPLMNPPKVEGRLFTKGVENTNVTDCISKVPVKTTFRVWCLYGLVDSLLTS
jgi:hypothetical protein